MSRPKLEFAQYYTLMTVLDQLGLERNNKNYQKIARLCRLGILPEPTKTDTFGNRYFDDEWVKSAKLVMDQWKTKLWNK